ncbi:ParA family protein [Chroococcus sp. FPU101]|uniref:ParA family protein n=1 Tax=Chroococcus sp. FPU101 TaxID=1974212 RepID=UPI001A8C09D1|nr:AAA family ATPase [Chroococcus sp. FPU101]GFE71902.1 Cobyrinic acid ac-diamide synthase [Chroococcus sp. FPU101]
MLKIAIFNFKGGTGKSTTALNLGACLATSKRKVLLIDLDGQRTLSFGLGLDGDVPTALNWLSGGEIQPVETKTKNLWLIPGDLGMFQLEADADLFTPALAKLNRFEICLMDCSPGLGVSSVQAILSSDRILIPVICEPAVLKGLSEAVQLIREERPNVPVDVVRVRYRPRLVITKESEDLLTEAARRVRNIPLKLVKFARDKIALFLSNWLINFLN